MKEEVKSRFSKGIIILLPLLFMSSIGGMLFCIEKFILSDDLIKTLLETIYYVLLSLLSFIGLVRYAIRNLFIITIYNDGIRFQYLFKDALIRWQDIKHISLTDSHFADFLLIESRYDAVLLLTKDKKEYFIPYRYYSNHVRLVKLMGKVENLLSTGSSQNIDLDEPVERKTAYEETKHIEGEKFSGTIFRSGNLYAMIFCGLVFNVFAVLFSFNQFSFFAFLFTIPVWLFFSLALSTTLYYYVLSENNLMVKNLVFFWRKKVYSLKDLRIVSIEKPFKNPRLLRVITNDFISDTYYGETLRKKTWKKLAEELEAKKVPVRIETDLS